MFVYTLHIDRKIDRQIDILQIDKQIGRQISKQINTIFLVNKAPENSIILALRSGEKEKNRIGRIKRYLCMYILIQKYKQILDSLIDRQIQSFSFSRIYENSIILGYKPENLKIYGTATILACGYFGIPRQPLLGEILYPGTDKQILVGGAKSQWRPNGAEIFFAPPP